MVRALAGDSTMTRFFGTAGSVAPGLYRALRPRGWAQEVLVDLEVRLGFGGRLRLAVGCPLAAGPVLVSRDRHRRVATRDRAGRDLHEPDVEVREEEDRRNVVDEHRPLAVHLAEIRAAQPDVTGRGCLEQVGQQRLLAVHVQDHVSDHVRWWRRSAAVRQPAEGPVRGGRSRSPGGRARPRPRRRCRPGRTSRSSGSRNGRRCTTSRSGRRGASRAPRAYGLPDRQPRFSAQRYACSPPDGAGRRGCRR